MNYEEIKKLWGSCISHDNSLSRYPENIVNQDADEVAGSLEEIFLYLTKKAKIRDKWQLKRRNIHHDLSIIALSEKQSHKYVIGIYNGEFYIESCILEPQNIKLMTSEFWATLSNLDLIKSFSFQEDKVVPKSAPIDIKTGKASTYRLIRNYILLEEHQPEPVFDLGWYHASWPLTPLSDKILRETVDFIKGIHKLNYLSYRRKYQKRHRKSLSS